MREGANAVLAAAARFYTPLIVLFAAALLIVRPAGEGVGFVSGLAFALALIAHALVFGATAARSAAPPWLMRALVAGALLVAAGAASAPRIIFAREIVEGALFLATAAGGALIVAVLFGRAPTMRNEAP